MVCFIPTTVNGPIPVLTVLRFTSAFGLSRPNYAFRNEGYQGSKGKQKFQMDQSCLCRSGGVSSPYFQRQRRVTVADGSGKPERNDLFCTRCLSPCSKCKCGAWVKYIRRYQYRFLHRRHLGRLRTSVSVQSRGLTHLQSQRLFIVSKTYMFIVAKTCLQSRGIFLKLFLSAFRVQ